jgi:outer membrane protein assembly factor BamD
MAGGWKTRRMAAPLLAAAMALAACGADVAGRSVPLDSFSAEEIYRLGEVELARSNPEEAARYFGEVERLYPYSEWSKRALIMQAFAFHRDRDYENSRASAQRYIDFYPADEDAAYAKYLLALSFYDQIDDVGRDQGLTFRALQALRRVIEEHPDSEYARSAILKFDLAFDHLGGKEMEIGRYYLKRRNYIAAANRFRVVVEQFQTTTHTPEALYRLIEVYLALGQTDEAQTAGAILGYNFQSTNWYQDGFSLLTGQGLRPEAQPTGWLSTVWRQTVRGEWL